SRTLKNRSERCKIKCVPSCRHCPRTKPRVEVVVVRANRQSGRAAWITLGQRIAPILLAAASAEAALELEVEAEAEAAVAVVFRAAVVLPAASSGARAARAAWAAV